jgi:hypothetical protein
LGSSLYTQRRTAAKKLQFKGAYFAHKEERCQEVAIHGSVLSTSLHTQRRTAAKKLQYMAAYFPHHCTHKEEQQPRNCNSRERILHAMKNSSQEVAIQGSVFCTQRGTLPRNCNTRQRTFHVTPQVLKPIIEISNTQTHSFPTAGLKALTLATRGMLSTRAWEVDTSLNRTLYSHNWHCS